MISKFEPHDLIALLLIASAVFMHTTGDTVITPMLLSSVVGFYFGRKSGETVIKKNENI